MCKRIMYVFLGIVLCVGFALAQAPATMKDNARSSDKEGEKMTSEDMAKHWKTNAARCLMLGDQEQVLMGKFALDRVQNSDVKQYVQSIIKDHNECITKLERFVPGATSTESLNQRVAAIRNEIKSEKGTLPVASESSGSSPDMSMDWKTMMVGNPHSMKMFAAMQQLMTENLVAFTQYELSEVDKDQFDHAYISQQIFNHIFTLAKLKTMEATVPADLKPILESATKANQTHLEQAKKLCKELDSKSSSTSSKSND